MRKKYLLSFIFIFLLSSSLIFVSAETEKKCVDLTNNLSRGKSSTDVKSLQTFLISTEYLKATPNGYFGPATQSAVRQYQKDNAIKTTGAVGPLTGLSVQKITCH